MSQCLAPVLPVIQGPTSKCLIFSSPQNYTIVNVISGNTYTWSCNGGTLTPNGTTASVIWDPLYTGTYSLIAHQSPDCFGEIFLQDCDCNPMPGIRELINFNDGNPLYTSLTDIAAAIDPVHASVVGTHIEVTGATLFIRGQFIISSTPVKFENCKLFMDKGSVIFTPHTFSGNYGVKFYHTELEGACNFMWEGIRLGLEGILEFDFTSSLKDAEYGIRINQKAHMRLKNTLFSRNYVTVYGEPRITGDPNLFLGLVENCEFNGDLPLVNGRYNGQNFYGQVAPNGRFPVPLPDNVSIPSRTFAAMEFHDLVTGLNSYSLPFSQTPNTTNKFRNLNVGIFGRNSNLDVFNCTFETIQPVNPNYTYGNFNGSSIYAETDDAPQATTYCNVGDLNTISSSKSNAFTDTYRSVFLKGNLDSHIGNNTIKNNTFISMEVRQSRLRTHLINNNSFDGTFHGIFSNLNPGSVINIEDNNLASLNNHTGGQWMIFISDAGPGNTCIANVTNNVILSYSTFGIRGWNNENSLYNYNGVTMNHVGVGTGKHVYGISLLGGRKNKVDCNYSGGPTYPPGSFYSNYQRSYFFQLSPDNTVSCNTATTSYFGYEFLSNCNPTNFHGNSHVDLYDGLLLGDYFNQVQSEMGPQNLVPSSSNTPGNLFLGRDHAGNFSHSATMTIRSFPFGSDLWVNSGLFYPLTNNTLNGVAFQPYIPTGIDPYECTNCGSGGSGGEQGMAEAIVLNPSNPNSIDEDLVKWDKEKNLFSKLLNDSALMDSSIVLQNFMDSAQYNNKGKFGDLVNDFTSIAEVQAGGASDSIIQLLLNACSLKNDAIVPEYSFEDAQKIINEIILHTVSKGIFEFTEPQMESIIEISNSCPFVNGPAVHQARSLANFIDPELDFDDFELCNNAPQLKKRNRPSSLKIIANIYPNPASELVSVYYPLLENENGELIITDLTGRQVFSKEINSYGDLIDINVGFINQGSYTILFNSRETMKSMGQLILIR